MVAMVRRVRDGVVVPEEGEDRAHGSWVGSEGEPAEDEEVEEEDDADENGFLKKNDDGDSRSVGRNLDGGFWTG